MKKSMLVLSLLVLVLYAPVASHAASADQKASVPRSDYFMVTGGLYIPTGEILSGNGGNNGWNVEASYGHYFYDKFTNNFGVEFSGAYYSVGSSSRLPDTNGNLYEFDMDLTMYTGVVSIKWEREFFSRVNLYAAAGGGLFVSDIEVNRSLVQFKQNPIIQPASDSSMDFQPGAQFKAGLQWSFDNGWNLGLDGKFISSKAVFKGGSVSPFPVEISLDGWVVNAQISYVW